MKAYLWMTSVHWLREGWLELVGLSISYHAVYDVRCLCWKSSNMELNVISVLK